MKTYEFTISGSGGKGDSWDGTIDMELSEEDYARVVASAKKGFWHMCDDEEISDIYDRIYAKAVDDNIRYQRDMIEEYREDYDLPEDATDREVIETYLEYQNCRIGYPYDLDPATQEENEEPDEDKIETIVWRPMFGVPGLEYVIGKRLKPEFYDDCVQNNSFHICLLKTAGDPVIAYFGLDRKIINLSGGGTYITKEKDGKTVREWLPYDLDTCSVKKEISRFLEEDDEG